METVHHWVLPTAADRTVLHQLLMQAYCCLCTKSAAARHVMINLESPK